MKVLLTGASGFLGGLLAERLRFEHEITTLGRVPSSDIAVDLGAPVAIRRVDANAVIHAAGIVGEGAADPKSYRRINVELTRELLDLAVRSGARRFVFISSGGVYAPSPSPVSESAPVEPAGEYARSKLDAERACHAYTEQLEIVNVRLFFPYGPGQRRQRFIPRMIERIRAREPIALNNAAGSPRMNPIFGADAAEAIARLVPLRGDATVNVAGPSIVSVREIAEAIARTIGADPRFVVGDAPTGLDRIGDVRLLREMTGFTPTVGFPEGIERMLVEPA